MEVERAYRIADIRGGNDTGVEEQSEKLDDGIKIEEHEDFLAPYEVPNVLSRRLHGEDTD